MIDLHCHILPHVDDGAYSLAESLAMIKQAVSEGITDIVATPHTYNGIYHLEAEQIHHEVAILQAAIEEAMLPVRIHPGAENHLHPDLIQDWLHHRLQGIGQNQAYILLEFPVISIPIYATQMIAQFTSLGVIPIIAHPERNIQFQREPHLLAQLIHLGAICQLTADSLTGRSGKRIRQFSEMLLTRRMIHVLASDAHNTSSRQPGLQRAYKLADELTCTNSTSSILKDQAAFILRGELFEKPTPVFIQTRRRYWIVDLFAKKRGKPL